MSRTLTPEDLTAHLTDEQRATIRAGGHAAQRIRDAVAAELPAIVRATYVAEAEAPVDPEGNEIEAWWQVCGVQDVALADSVGEVLQRACGRLRTDVDVDELVNEFVAEISPEADHASEE